MRRFFLCHRLWLAPLCLLLISSYVLFDVLDIDGSNLGQPAAISGVEDETFADHTKHNLLPVGSAAKASGGGALALLPTPLSGLFPRSCPSGFLCLAIRPRRAPHEDAASPPPGSDPARPFA